MDETRLDDLSPEEIRVLGCLIEKEATVPDSYPLTSNSLRAACNQSTSRDPVVSYGDLEIERALSSLRSRGLTRTVHSTSNRATKYRHVVPEVLRLDPGETALMAVLMLRGPQTVGELKTRCERQHSFESTDEVSTLLAGLAARDEPLAVQLERQPGQKDARWAHLLAPADDATGSSAPTGASGALEDGTAPDHLTSVFDHDRLRIDVGRRPGDLDGHIDVRVTVRAQHFGGTVTEIMTTEDLEAFAADLERDAGPCRLGRGRAVQVELRGEPVNGTGPNLNLECNIVRTEDDPQEWLQFVMFGVPPFADDTAARIRSVLAEPAGRVTDDPVRDTGDPSR